MANNITIGGATVDADDPCALYKALNNIRLKMLAGESVSEIQIQDFNSSRRTRYSSFVNDRRALEQELAHLADLCQQSKGGRPKRFAIRAGQRPIR